MSWNDNHSTVPAPTKVGAFLGNDQVFHTFRFNPSEAEWSYKESMFSQDTLGGRVVQVLSTNIEALTVQGSAGSRRELQKLAANIRDIMQFHIETLHPVYFRVPSRNWNFSVYVEAMPQIGWDVQSTSYPYTLQLRILEDISGTKSEQIRNRAIAGITRLNQGIGYIPGVHGGNADQFVSITEVLAENLVNAGAVYDDGGSNGGNSGSGEWADYPNGRIPLSSMVRVAEGCSTRCCPSLAPDACYMIPPAAEAFFDMQTAYGSTIPIVSAYRSYELQTCWYNNHGIGDCSGVGPIVARPGTSNHGLGKAFDMTSSGPTWEWVKAHCEAYQWSWYGSDDPGHFSYHGV